MLRREGGHTSPCAHPPPRSGRQTRGDCFSGARPLLWDEGAEGLPQPSVVQGANPFSHPPPSLCQWAPFSAPPPPSKALGNPRGHLKLWGKECGREEGPHRWDSWVTMRKSLAVGLSAFVTPPPPPKKSPRESIPPLVRAGMLWGGGGGCPPADSYPCCWEGRLGRPLSCKGAAAGRGTPPPAPQQPSRILLRATP